MDASYVPFVLVPLLVYTYFWMNPHGLAAFMEGLMKSIAEIYLGYKQWKIERETIKAYRCYQHRSRRLAKQNGLARNTVNAYFSAYKDEDWRLLFEIHKEKHEAEYKDIEDELRDMLFF